MLFSHYRWIKDSLAPSHMLPRDLPFSVLLLVSTDAGGPVLVALFPDLYGGSHHVHAYHA
jgi:hypothetical protein